MTRHILSLTLALAFFVFVGCDSSIKEQYQAEKKLFKARKLHERIMINPRVANQLDYQLAQNAYEEILRIYKENMNNAAIQAVKKQSFVSLSELWLLQGEVQKAIEVYERFLTVYPDDKQVGPLVHFANAKSNERIYNIEKAITEYKTLLDGLGEISDPMKPSLPMLNLPLKVARLERAQGANGANGSDQKYYQDALNYYTSIVSKNPVSPAAFAAGYYTASIYLDQRQWRDAVHTLNRLVKEFPDRSEIPNILLTIANLYFDGLNMPQEGERLLDNILRKYPGHAIEGYAYFARARRLVAARRTADARKLLKWILENESYQADTNLRASAQLTLAYAYELEGNWERALVEYRWVSENYPTTKQGLYVPTYIAQSYLKKGKKNLAGDAFNDAIKHYRNLVKKFPKTVLAGTAQEYVIYAYLAQEDWANAEKAVSALQTIYPGSQSQMNSALMLGQIHEHTGDIEKAIAAYEGFMVKFPEHPIFADLQKRVGALRNR